MDYHAKQENQEDAAIGADDGPFVARPARTDARHHLAGCLPCLPVGRSWVEVAARTEEQTREADEGEGDEDRPGFSVGNEHFHPSADGDEAREAQEDAP